MGQPSPFDSEDAPGLVGSVFGDIEVQSWEVVAYRLPDEQAIADYLHGFNVPDWETRVDAIKPAAQHHQTRSARLGAALTVLARPALARPRASRERGEFVRPVSAISRRVELRTRVAQSR